MIVTAWNNGSWRATGAGYGVKVNREDRDRFFKRRWGSVTLTFEGSTTKAKVNVAKKSFWRPECGELIKMEIGIWLQANGMASWPEDEPPKLWLEPLSDDQFFLHSGA
jgi:hypothetical protein